MDSCSRIVALCDQQIAVSFSMKRETLLLIVSGWLCFVKRIDWRIARRDDMCKRRL